MSLECVGGEQCFLSMKGQVAEGGSLAKSLRGERDFLGRVCRRLLRCLEYTYICEAA